MSPRHNDIEVSCSFSISPQDASLTDARVQKLLAQAIADATDQAKKDGYEVETKSDLDGGFLDFGATTALLLLAAKSATVAKMLAAAAAGGKVVVTKVAEGGATAAGAFFFTKYLAPRLRHVNLLPAKFRAAKKKSAPTKSNKTESGTTKPKNKKKMRASKRD
jgi:hypothetical protein